MFDGRRGVLSFRWSCRGVSWVGLAMADAGCICNTAIVDKASSGWEWLRNGYLLHRRFWQDQGKVNRSRGAIHSVPWEGRQRLSNTRPNTAFKF
jgi:hypothetical protein